MRPPSWWDVHPLLVCCPRRPGGLTRGCQGLTPTPRKQQGPRRGHRGEPWPVPTWLDDTRGSHCIQQMPLFILTCLQKSKCFQTQLRYKIQHKMRFITISPIKQKIFQKSLRQNQLVDPVFLFSPSRHRPPARALAHAGPGEAGLVATTPPGHQGQSQFLQTRKVFLAGSRRRPVPCQKQCHGATATWPRAPFIRAIMLG